MTLLLGPTEDRGLAVSLRARLRNAEAKLLLISHAFETLGVAQVDSKTDARNLRCRRALESLGPIFDLRRRAAELVSIVGAVQHPDGDDPRAVQSVAIHLMTPGLFLKRGADPVLGTRLRKRMVDRPVFHWPDPPSRRGQLTVADVPTGPDAAAARTSAYAWAADAWAAWGSHHDTVRRWLNESGFDPSVLIWQAIRLRRWWSSAELRCVA